MKSVWFTDVHVHPYKRFDNNNSRLNNCIKVIIDAFELAQESEAQAIFFCGDLFDQQKSLPTIVINKITKLFKHLFQETSIDFYAISGNHDQASKNLYGQPCVTALEFLDTAFPRFHLIDNQLIEYGNQTILGIPYYEYTEDFYKAIGDQEADILMIHNTPQGITNKNIHTDFDPAVLKRFKRVMCGHIHQAQVIRKNFHILGSPLHRDLGDVGQEKGIYLLNHSSDELSFMPLDYPQFTYTEAESQYYVEEIIEQDEEEAVDTQKFATSVGQEDLIKNYIEQIKEDAELIKTGVKCV